MARTGNFTPDHPSPVLGHPDGVTTGFIRIPEKRIRSMVDRLGKAARKGDSAAAWMMVGRVQAELTALLGDD